jgi:hypothetical protein
MVDGVASVHVQTDQAGVESTPDHQRRFATHGDSVSLDLSRDRQQRMVDVCRRNRCADARVHLNDVAKAAVVNATQARTFDERY